MTNAQRNVLGIAIVAVAVIVGWLALAWSPRADTEQLTTSEPDVGAQALVAPQSAPAQAAAPPPSAAAKVAPPAPVAPAAPAEPEPAPERIPTPHPMSLEQVRPPEAYGPLAEYKQRWASESRSADSSATEQKFRHTFDVPNIPAELIRDISCRRSMCKLDLSWKPERWLGFVVVLESSKHTYDKRVAVEPGTREADGSYLTKLYIRMTP